jgi:hypothetical protein
MKLTQYTMEKSYTQLAFCLAEEKRVTANTEWKMKKSSSRFFSVHGTEEEQEKEGEDDEKVDGPHTTAPPSIAMRGRNYTPHIPTSKENCSFHPRQTKQPASREQQEMAKKTQSFFIF